MYVAGPFRAGTAWDIELNVRKAETVSLELFKMGYAPICPHANSRYFHGSLPDSEIMDAYLTILSKCDVMYILPGFETSEGTRRELKEAIDLHIPTVASPFGAAEWMSDWKLEHAGEA